MNDTDYVAAIDDSGGVEPLAKWGGEFAPGDHPITVLAWVFIKTNHLAEFEARWLALRQEIQDYLGCPDLPPIHLRLMYGRDLPKKYRRKPNPYKHYAPSFSKIVEWLAKAILILDDFNSRRRVLGQFVFVKERRNAYAPIERYFAEPAFVAEMQFLKEHSTGTRAGMAAKYLKHMASPLLPILADAFLFVDEQMRQIGNKTVAVKIDPFAEAHGIDPRSVLHAMRQIGTLERITSIEVMEDSDAYQLSQAADLIGYLNFRREMGRRGFMTFDPIADRLLQGQVLRHFSAQDLKRHVVKRFKIHWETTTPIHYAVARGVIEAIDREFADQYLVDAEEMKARVLTLIKHKGAEGLSMLKDPSVCAHLVRLPINGDDPG